MTGVLIIVSATCVALICLVLVKPQMTFGRHSVSIYWIAPLLGAALLTLFSYISPQEIWEGLTADTSINPIKILVLFLSMTLMSIYLDEAGFFKYLANEVLKKAKTSQTTLFVYLYVIVSVLTVFTSNDIIILTFTPFICYFSKSAKINPLPYLFAEFVAANTWSLMLIIGNPTNVFLATASGIGFLEYASVMALPTIAGGVTAFALLYLIFHKCLKSEIMPMDEHIVIEDKAALILGLAHLSLCTVMLTVASYTGLEMWLISFAFACSLAICTLVLKLIRALHRQTGTFSLSRCAKRAPWELLPFVLSMFVLVLALEKTGFNGKIATLFERGNTILEYGLASFVTANAINNIPMSVLFSSIAHSASAASTQSAVYASIIGSNVCAFFTPMGALAGIMWASILKKQGVKLSFVTFIKYGALISLPTLFISLLTLMLRLT